MMLKKLLTYLGVVILSVSLIGCATQEQTGTVVGGALGALVGTQFGGGSGRAAATVVGALVGGFIGQRIGRNMDDVSRQRAEAAAHRAIASNQRTTWHSEQAHGSVTPVKTYQSEGRTCRRYKSAVFIDGQAETVYGKACLINGRWRSVSQ